MKKKLLLSLPYCRQNEKKILSNKHWEKSTNSRARNGVMPETMYGMSRCGSTTVLLKQNILHLNRENYAAHFGHTVHFRAAPCLLTGNALPAGPFICNFYSVCSIPKIKYPYTSASFCSLVLEYGGREPYFWDMPRTYLDMLPTCLQHSI